MKKHVKKISSLFVEIIGWCLVLIGIAALVLPGPGLLAILAGLVLLSMRYEWAERRLEPVREAAIQAAHESVASLPKLFFSTLAAVSLICFGIFWGIGPEAPGWWPLNNTYWLIGGWGTGGALIGSGVIALIIIVYSFITYRKK